MLPSYPPSQAESNVLRLLRYPRLLLLPNGSPSSKHARRERCDIPCNPRSSGLSQLLPPAIDLAFMGNPGTTPEQLVVAVQNLMPLLPSGYEVLGEGDIKILGSHPVSEGGFAEVWVGEMKDGTRVAIKSQRRHSSLDCLPAFLVSGERSAIESTTLSSPDVTYRGCTGKL